MPLPCSICQHPQRGSIDRALVTGTPIPELTARYRASPDALLRHKHRHLPLRLVRAHDAEEATEADQLLADVRDLRDRALALLGTAEAAGDLKTALSGVREARACLELLAKLQGALDERPQVTVNVLLSAEWLSVRAALLEALEPYQEAALAVAARLRALEPG